MTGTLGGTKPTDATMRVPYGQTVHGEEEIAAVVEVLRTSTQMGTRVRTFERRIADYLRQPPPAEWDGVFVAVSKTG